MPLVGQGPPYTFAPRMIDLTRRTLLELAALLVWRGASPAKAVEPAAESPQPFGDEFPDLDSLAVGEWWTKRGPRQNPPPAMDVPRDQVVAFAVYTHDAGV